MALPENGYQVSCLGVGRDEAHAKEIGDAAGSLIYLLATERDLDLRALDGITFASDYAKALADLDRGFTTRSTLSATEVPHAQGVAMTPTIIRDSEIRFRIVASAWVGIGLLHEDELLRSQAIYTLCHEAAHVHHESQWYKAFPNTHGLPIAESGKISALLSAMFSSFSEYAVCRTTATIRPESVSDYETGFTGAIEHTFSVRTQRMRAYLLDRNHQRILDEMAALFGQLLKLSAYLLGHLDGLEMEMEEAAPGAHTLLQKHPALSAAIQSFHNELRKLWDTEGTWPGFDAYFALHECAINLLAAYSVTLTVSGAGFNVSVPLEVMGQFIDIQRIEEHAQELAAAGNDAKPDPINRVDEA
jgi:hypothetical protein